MPHMSIRHTRAILAAGSMVTAAALTVAAFGAGAGAKRVTAVAATPLAAAKPSSAPAPRTVSVDSSSPVCSTDQLSVASGSPQGTAGSLYLQLAFTNISDRACTLYGYSGVSLLTTPRGPQLGAAAARQPAQLTAVPVNPGKRAVETLRLTNPEAYPAASCGLTSAAGLRIYPPDQTAPVWIPRPLPGCSSTSEALLQVWPIRPAA